MALSDAMILGVLGLVTCVCGAIGLGFTVSLIADWANRVLSSTRAREEFEITQQGTGQSRTALLMMRYIPERYRQTLAETGKKLDPRKKRRAHSFSLQLPDALDQIAQALGAGLSLPQSIERASAYMAEPIASELKKVYGHMSISHSFEESFNKLCEAYDSPELRLVCSGIAVQSKLGGNMKKMLQRSARYCRQSLALERSLKAQTAQSRLSFKVILCAPFVLCGVLSFLMPSFISNLLFTSTGRGILMVAIALDVIGVAWARQMLRVDMR